MNQESFPKALRDKYKRVVEAGLYNGPISDFAVVEHLIYNTSHKSHITLKAWLKMMWDAEQDKGEYK